MSLKFVLRDAFASIELVYHQFHDHVFLEEVEGSSLVYCTLNCFFLLGSLDDSLLNGTFGNQLIDVNISALSDTMGSICGLSIHGGIPIVIVEDDGVCCSESNSQST